MRLPDEVIDRWIDRTKKAVEIFIAVLRAIRMLLGDL